MQAKELSADDVRWLDTLSNRLGIDHELSFGKRGFGFGRGDRYLMSSHAIEGAELYRTFWGVRQGNEYVAYISREGISFVLEKWLITTTSEEWLLEDAEYRALCMESTMRFVSLP